MAKRMTLELPDELADFVDEIYKGKSPQATIKQILKDIKNNKTIQGVNYGRSTK
ncbi:hypothetical protein FM038_25415 [Shewanella eurypsychrophilus]|uniref:Uncharacterized protein n=1 Tax=Shewanella eurypsychrophilus TaxID=2593656 RepID=A0ABX8S516_9GAMM|nr:MULTISPECIES: hypothetical protein [Shewanella]QXP44793.1 hypothetical protein FM038_25415 [Shewanella eurypsychrophilus]